MGLFLTQLLSLNEKIWMEMCTEGQCIKGYRDKTTNCKERLQRKGWSRASLQSPRKESTTVTSSFQQWIMTPIGVK